MSNGGEPMYTPAARGIHTPLEIDGNVLHSLCLRSLPRGTLEFSHELTALQEDRDGMALSFQVRLMYALPHWKQLERPVPVKPACPGFHEVIPMSLKWLTQVLHKDLLYKYTGPLTWLRIAPLQCPEPLAYMAQRIHCMLCAGKAACENKDGHRHKSIIAWFCKGAAGQLSMGPRSGGSALQRICPSSRDLQLRAGASTTSCAPTSNPPRSCWNSGRQSCDIHSPAHKGRQHAATYSVRAYC